MELLGFGRDTGPTKTFDLVVTDYRMPRMTGEDLLGKIKEVAALQDVPLILVSSENCSELQRRCLQSGALAFISKPLKLSDVGMILHILRAQCCSSATLSSPAAISPEEISTVEADATHSEEQFYAVQHTLSSCHSCKPSALASSTQSALVQIKGGKSLHQKQARDHTNQRWNKRLSVRRKRMKSTGSTFCSDLDTVIQKS
eukprot:TRINITY_DN6385_c0_g1_i3.p1 TRINITY_DN6385_c0_g1~~TRINITY_DN6385_c0_g1_i3.p1  ORF type:complete len:201 (+),score=4.95 TRINITY_DN6385_c0_g1_i3:157-759(+)